MWCFLAAFKVACFPAGVLFVYCELSSVSCQVPLTNLCSSGCVCLCAYNRPVCELISAVSPPSVFFLFRYIHYQDLEDKSF